MWAKGLLGLGGKDPVLFNFDFLIKWRWRILMNLPLLWSDFSKVMYVLEWFVSLLGGRNCGLRRVSHENVFLFLGAPSD